MLNTLLKIIMIIIYKKWKLRLYDCMTCDFANCDCNDKVNKIQIFSIFFHSAEGFSNCIVVQIHKKHTQNGTNETNRIASQAQTAHSNLYFVNHLLRWGFSMT